jgi:D-alanyl-D-alanine carboxypeptidase
LSFSTPHIPHAPHLPRIPRSRAGIAIASGVVAFVAAAVAVAGSFLLFQGSNSGERTVVENAGVSSDFQILFHEDAEGQPCERCDGAASLPPVESEPVATRRVGPNFVIESKAAVLYEPACGEVLYAKNPDMRLAPASLTKMLTALVAIDAGVNPSNITSPQISAKALKRDTGSSVMGLEPGMQPTIEDLLFGLMLPSGNDAAIVLAQASMGMDSFIEAMNAKAAQLGMTNSHFTNPHGLDDPGGLYSTARDILTLEEAMMANPYLAWIASTPNYTTVHDDLSFKNGDKMLKTYPGTIGGKIGFTDDAAHTIAVSAVRDGRRLDIAVLGSQVPYVDATALLDWGFNEAPSSC